MRFPGLKPIWQRIERAALGGLTRREQQDADQKISQFTLRQLKAAVIHAIRNKKGDQDMALTMISMGDRDCWFANTGISEDEIQAFQTLLEQNPNLKTRILQLGIPKLMEIGRNRPQPEPGNDELTLG